YGLDLVRRLPPECVQPHGCVGEEILSPEHRRRATHGEGVDLEVTDVVVEVPLREKARREALPAKPSPAQIADALEIFDVDRRMDDEQVDVRFPGVILPGDGAAERDDREQVAD